MTFSKSKKNVKPNIEKKELLGRKWKIIIKKKLKGARKDDGKKY